MYTHEERRQLLKLGAVNAGPVKYDLGHIRVGRLPTVNQDAYPGLGDYWVQLRIGQEGEEVLARVYGNTPEQAHNRAAALAAQAQPEIEERPCQELDGCPTELAVLQRFWRQHQQPVSGADGLPTDLELDAWAEDLSRLGYESNREGVEAYLRKLFSDRAALAQQDADKLDAERYRAWRDAAVTNSTPFVRAMRDTLPPEAREGKPRWPTAAEWDAAIDAARKEKGE